MEINPKKMDFDKMKSDENLEGDANANQAGNVDGIGSGAKHNPAPSFVPPAASAPAPNSSQPTASLKKPTELLSEAWEMYKARWKTFLGIMVVPTLFFVISIFILTRFSIVAMGLLPGGIMYSNPFIILILFSILYLIMIIIWIWSQATLVYAIKNSEEKIGVKESYRRGWHKLKPFFWVLILLNLIISSGFILFYIPGIIFSIWFSFAVYIVVAEDLKGMNAILKSREYVRGHWWQTLWRFLFIFLVAIGIFIGIALFSMIMMILTGIILSSIGEAANVVGPVLYLSNFLLVVVAVISIVPFMTIYSFLVYSDLKKIKGDFEFKPSSKIKTILIIIAVLQPLIIMFGIISAFSSIYSVLNDIRNDTVDTHMDTHNESNIYKEDANNAEETFEDNIKDRDKQRIFDLSSISKMLRRYKTENGIYPVSRASVKLNENNQITNKIKFANESASIPVDPKDPEYYYSYQSSNGKSFELSARLENLDDPSCDFEIKARSNICIYKLRY